MVQVFIDHLMKLLNDGEYNRVSLEIWAGFERAACPWMTVSENAGDWRDTIDTGSGQGRRRLNQVPHEALTDYKTLRKHSAMARFLCKQRATTGWKYCSSCSAPGPPLTSLCWILHWYVQHAIQYWSRQVLFKNRACVNPPDGDARGSLRALEAAGSEVHVAMAKFLMPQINTQKQCLVHRTIAPWWSRRQLVDFQRSSNGFLRTNPAVITIKSEAIDSCSIRIARHWCWEL